MMGGPKLLVKFSSSSLKQLSFDLIDSILLNFKRLLMKTRFVLLVSLLLVGVLTVKSQTLEAFKNSLRIESGYAFTGSGDLSGYCIYNEYNRTIGKNFKISPSIGILNFFGNVFDNVYNKNLYLQNANCISFDLTAYYDLLITTPLSLACGAGGYLRKWHWLYATTNDQVLLVNGKTVGTGSYLFDHITSPGYTASIGILFTITNRLDISLKGVYQNDDNGDNSVTARGGLLLGF